MRRRIALLAAGHALCACLACGGIRTCPQDESKDTGARDTGSSDSASDAPPADAQAQDDAAPTALIVSSPTVELFGGVVDTLAPRITDSAGPVVVTANLPFDQTATTFVLLDEDGRDETPMMVVHFDMATVLLTFVPELTMASEYNLVVHAVANAGAGALYADLWAPIFTNPPGDHVQTPNVWREVIDPVMHVELLHLIFDEPIGTGSPAQNSLDGDNCVLFFDYPLVGADIGDDPGEYGNPECRADLALRAEEPDPPGLAGQSGFTQYWKATLPTLPGPSSIPSGTPFAILFSRATDTAHIVRRTNGQVVQDFIGTLWLVVP